MNKWRVYLTNGTSVLVESRYYFVSKRNSDHIFDNYSRNSAYEDTKARFSPSSVMGVVKV